VNEYVTWLLQTYGRKHLFVDTNVLLPLVIGSYDRTLIPRFKRTTMYTVEDYDLALRFVGLFDQLVTTPSVLTEVSNLAAQLGSSMRAQCFEVFSRIVQRLEERHTPSATIVESPAFLRFGLTDATALRIAHRDVIVLTDDLRLASHMEQESLPVLNFTHLRAPNLLQ
jgi:hypothetical protein